MKTRADWDANGSNPNPSGFESGGKFTNYSQEFDLLSPDDKRFRWVTGLFWQNYINDIPSWPDAGLDFFTTDAPTPTFATPWIESAGTRRSGTTPASARSPSTSPMRWTLQLGGRYGHYEFTQFTEWELVPTVGPRHPVLRRPTRPAGSPRSTARTRSTGK